MTRRWYTAQWDDGHDHGEFDYYSEHRAGSKANLEDARAEAHRRYGRSANGKTITDTRLKDSW